MIDDALLRPGRMDVQVEIGLPDKDGRFDILTIHTSHMRNNNMLDGAVDLRDLAEKTRNFSGAEIEGLVKSAANTAMNRLIKVTFVCMCMFVCVWCHVSYTPGQYNHQWTPSRSSRELEL